MYESLAICDYTVFRIIDLSDSVNTTISACDVTMPTLPTRIDRWKGFQQPVFAVVPHRGMGCNYISISSIFILEHRLDLRCFSAVVIPTSQRHAYVSIAVTSRDLMNNKQAPAILVLESCAIFLVQNMPVSNWIGYYVYPFLLRIWNWSYERSQPCVVPGGFGRFGAENQLWVGCSDTKPVSFRHHR